MRRRRALDILRRYFPGMTLGELDGMTVASIKELALSIEAIERHNRTAK